MVVSKDKKTAICSDCVSGFYHLLDDFLEKPSDSITGKKENAPSFNSMKIKNFLDTFVVGQEDAKISLAVGVVNHYKRIFCGKKQEGLSKSNILIVGPSGSGKSLLVDTIAKFLHVPFISIDTTTLTEAGYIGQNVDTVIRRLWEKCGQDIELTQRGIVFLDEIDKLPISKHLGMESHSIGIQSSLLKMVEGTKIAMDSSIEIDTQNILFIGGGAFVGMKDILKRRKHDSKSIGFNGLRSKRIDFKEYTTEDYIEYGLIPEFIGRFPVRVYTNELGKDELSKILHNPKNNILNDYKFYFHVDGITSIFEDSFIDEISSLAVKEKTGVRGMRSICDKIIAPHLYKIEEYKKKKIKKIIFQSAKQDALPKLEKITKS